MPPKESLVLYIGITQKRFKNKNIIKQGYYVYKLYIYIYMNEKSSKHIKKKREIEL